MSKTSKLDDRGECDLERVIEEQRNHIIILERHLEESKEEIDRLKKQIKLLQNSIRTWTKKSTTKVN
jgi:polyhydroxyalkanoate synthesis regulator phasin